MTQLGRPGGGKLAEQVVPFHGVGSSVLLSIHPLLLVSLASSCDVQVFVFLTHFYREQNCFLFWEVVVVCSRVLQSFYTSVIHLLFLLNVLPVLFSFWCWWLCCYCVIALQLGVSLG